MMESMKNEIHLEEMSSQNAELMLQFIYKGTLDNIPKELNQLLDLIDCAERFDLDELKTKCFFKIFSSGSLTLENASTIALATEKYRARPEFIDAIQDYCLR